MTASEKRQWIEGKGKSKRLFAPELGGSYEVFNERPLPEEIALYCTQDVKLMPKLWNFTSTGFIRLGQREWKLRRRTESTCHIRRGTIEKDRTGL
jgi:hypothetical protein